MTQLPFDLLGNRVQFSDEVVVDLQIVDISTLYLYLLPQQSDDAGEGEEEIDFIGYAQALFDYEAEAPTELTVAAGEVLGIIGMADSNGNPEWWHVSVHGEEGYSLAEQV